MGVSTLEYTVAGMSCDHCKAAVTEEVLAVAASPPSTSTSTRSSVVVHGEDLDDAAIRAAIDEAGYEAA